MKFEIPNKPLLVGGATGALGQEVVRALLEHGANIRVFVRSREKVAALPESVERVIGDLQDESAVQRAVQGVHAAFFVAPHDDAEERIADIFRNATIREGVRLVFGGVHADGANRVSRFIKRMFTHLAMPHYDPKMRISEKIRTSHPDPVLILPGNYYQMDELVRDQILAGTYPVPLRLAPRADTRDVGDAAARALLDSSVRSGAYWVVGPESLSGEQTAAHWSAALGREVRYKPDFELVDRLAQSEFGGRKAADAQKSLRVAVKFAIKTTPAQLQQTTYLLGRPPRSHVEYVRDTVAIWQQSARA